MNVPMEGPICPSGKRPMKTRDEALRQLKSARHLRLQDRSGVKRHGDVERGINHCRVCGWWHLTSSTGAGSRGSFQRKRTDRRS